VHPRDYPIFSPKDHPADYPKLYPIDYPIQCVFIRFSSYLVFPSLLQSPAFIPFSYFLCISVFGPNCCPPPSLFSPASNPPLPLHPLSPLSLSPPAPGTLNSLPPKGRTSHTPPAPLAKGRRCLGVLGLHYICQGKLIKGIDMVLSGPLYALGTSTDKSDTDCKLSMRPY
jgi:hypothetical protein